jgi:hypothetical protein
MILNMVAKRSSANTRCELRAALATEGRTETQEQQRAINFLRNDHRPEPSSSTRLRAGRQQDVRMRHGALID